MSSGQLSASLEVSVEAYRPPLDYEIGGVFPMTGASNNSGKGETRRTPSPGFGHKTPPNVAPSPLRLAAVDDDSLTERRTNIGNFQRIVVAEDHRGTRRMLIQMLRTWGFVVLPAKSGPEVLNIVEQTRPPELIVLSRMLPGIDIFELCQRLCCRHSDYSPYILVLAMQSDQREVVRALESGAAEYLTTPFEAQELRARLLVASRILKRQENLILSRDKFRCLATTDPLTGVWNRRSINQILKDELARASGSEASTGVLLVDLDHFKKVNDTHGHLAGDFVLQETSRRLKNALRPYDSIGRYGGEEFLVVVPNAAEAELCQLAERLRKAIESESIRVGESQIRITLSIGATIAPSGESLLSKVIATADAALYNAKRFGRNRFMFADPLQEQVAHYRSQTNALPHSGRA